MNPGRLLTAGRRYDGHVKENYASCLEDPEDRNIHRPPIDDFPKLQDDSQLQVRRRHD